MSRSGYVDGIDQWDLIRWRGAVSSALRGRRGQAFLHEMLAALDALPTPRLISYELENGGEVCAIGSVGLARGLDMSALNIEEPGPIADVFGIAQAMVMEIEYINDEACPYSETPEARFSRLRNWVVTNITSAK